MNIKSIMDRPINDTSKKSTIKKIFPEYTLVQESPLTICRAMVPEVFEYPFFNEGVAKLSSQTSIFTKYTLEDIEVPGNSQLIELKGFIFNTSHCGSTLLSRMLNESPDIRVVSESEAINGLLLAYLLHELPKNETLTQLKSIIDAYRQPMNKEKYLIFKLTSWNIFLANLFLELYPSIKWIYIDRNTEDVVKSLQKSDGGFETWWDHPVDILKKHFLGQNFYCKTKEIFLTRMVEQHRKHAFKYKNDKFRTITYPDFLTQFDKVILPHFDLNFSYQHLESANKLLAFKAKSFDKILYSS